MTLLIPLGLLGLVSIIALIVIYIIKPNYQHKEVTSTYVWKLSLKYRKRRLPTSKLRNIFLILCQVLALVAGALVMAQPIIRDETKVLDTEVVAVIDASASMRAENDNGVTRFERAVNEVIGLSERVIAGGGYMSVILSDGNDSFLAQKAGLAAKDNLILTLNSLIESRDRLACSYGANDFDKSIDLCADIVRSNPSASIYIYTDSNYAYVPEGMTVINVADEAEWNAGILNAYSKFEEGYYTFFVEVGCYSGVAQNVTLNVAINGADSVKEEGLLVQYSKEVFLADNSVTTVIFRNDKITEADYEQDAENVIIVPVGDQQTGLYNTTLVVAYDDALISIDSSDSLDGDNTFSIYGGRKPELKIQYATTKRMSHISTLVGNIRNAYSDSYELVFDIVDVPSKEPANTGYDFYIFERCSPESNLMPKDGVVWLLNPPAMPDGISSAGTTHYNRNMYLVQDNYHPILQNTDASQIFVTMLTRLQSYDSTVYQPLWSVDNNPVLLLNDGEHEKVIVALFDIEFSNFSMELSWPYFWVSVIETFLPPTVVGNAYEVGQDIQVKGRGDSLTVSRNSGSDEKVITSFPASIRLDTPDTYRFSQVDYFGKTIADQYIFVKMPSVESNISAEKVTLKPIYVEKEIEDKYQDLLVYFAAAMLALLFTEWFLQTQDSL